MRGVSYEEVLACRRFHSVKSSGRGHSRQTHGHGLEELVLDSAGDAQRNDTDAGPPEVCANVPYPACNGDTGELSEGADLARWSGPANRELYFGNPLADERENIVTEPEHAVDIGKIV